MKTLTLTRHNKSENGTFGALAEKNEPICVTCELPWKDNQNKISCIPVGTYKVTPFNSPSKGDVYLVNDVPNRDMIEIHIGNTIKDILGCIAVGMTFGKLGYMPAVLQSKDALALLKKKYPEGFMLEVI